MNRMLRPDEVTIVTLALIAGWRTGTSGDALATTLIAIMATVAVVVCGVRAAALAREQRAREDAERSARTDALTGIVNRRGLDEELARREGQAGGPVVLVDLVRFKEVNDTYGHPAGDDLLAGVARILMEEVGEEPALVARSGGDEFALLLADGVEEAEALLTRVSRRFADEVVADHRFSKVALSAGIAAAEPGVSPERLMGRADLALYHAKLAERTSVRWAPGMTMPEQKDARRRFRD